MLTCTRFLSIVLLILLSGKLCSQVLVIAHRGASAYEPENTLAAFEKAIEMKADYIETDVQQTKDSVLVLMHDLSFTRTCDFKTPAKLVSNLIKDLSYKQFLQLRIKNKDYGPPTLDSAIKLINGRCKLLIELKKGSEYYPGIEKRVIELIAKNKAETWIDLIHSFHKEALLNVNKQENGVKLQKLIVFKLPLSSFNFSKGFSRDDFKDWRGVNVYYKFANKRLIKKLHNQNKTVYAWTVNSSKKAKKLINRGIDGIITNKPDMVKEILGNK